MIGVPAQLDKLYALLNGANGAKPSDTIGHMAELKELTVSNICLHDAVSFKQITNITIAKQLPELESTANRAYSSERSHSACHGGVLHFYWHALLHGFANRD